MRLRNLYSAKGREYFYGYGGSHYHAGAGIERAHGDSLWPWQCHVRRRKNRPEGFTGCKSADCLYECRRRGMAEASGSGDQYPRG